MRTRDYLASDEAYLDVTVPIAALEHAQLGASAVPLQLLDTPGPNEAGEESLKFQVDYPAPLPPGTLLVWPSHAAVTRMPPQQFILLSRLCISLSVAMSRHWHIFMRLCVTWGWLDGFIFTAALQ